MIQEVQFCFLTFQPRLGGGRVGELFDKSDITERDALPSARDLGKEPMLDPPPGRVKISCSDDKGRNSDIWIEVKRL